MRLIQTKIPDVVLIEPTVFEDERGWFMESFNEQRFHQELSRLGLPIPSPFVQDNHSCSQKGVLRGLHYQLPPHAQGKLVRVTQGAAFDVAVDIRKGSLTFGQWVSAELNSQNKHMLWIPEGFAHGFVVLSESADFLYKTTNYYAPQSDRGLMWNDPDIGVAWPNLGMDFLLSDKDQKQPLLQNAEVFGA